MRRISISDGDSDKEIVILGDQSVESALSAHGYKSDVDYVVERGNSDRLEELEAATAVAGKGPSRGVSQRMDSIEDEIAAIKDELDMS